MSNLYNYINTVLQYKKSDEGKFDSDTFLKHLLRVKFSNNRIIDMEIQNMKLNTKICSVSDGNTYYSDFKFDPNMVRINRLKVESDKRLIKSVIEEFYNDKEDNKKIQYCASCIYLINSGIAYSLFPDIPFIDENVLKSYTDFINNNITYIKNRFLDITSILKNLESITNRKGEPLFDEKYFKIDTYLTYANDKIFYNKQKDLNENDYKMLSQLNNRMRQIYKDMKTPFIPTSIEILKSAGYTNITFKNCYLKYKKILDYRFSKALDNDIIENSIIEGALD